MECWTLFPSGILKRPNAGLGQAPLTLHYVFGRRFTRLPINGKRSVTGSILKLDTPLGFLSNTTTFNRGNNWHNWQTNMFNQQLHKLHTHLVTLFLFDSLNRLSFDWANEIIFFFLFSFIHFNAGSSISSL